MIRTGLAMSTAATAAVLTLTGCSSSALAADASRPAKSVGPASTALLNDASPARIVIGWGQTFTPGELSTPPADQVQARCTGAGNDLRIKISAPEGWTVYMTAHSPKLRVTNSDQHFDAELDATPKIPGLPTPIEWTDSGVDLAAAAYVPDDWNSRYGPGQQFYLAAKIDCGAA